MINVMTRVQSAWYRYLHIFSFFPSTCAAAALRSGVLFSSLTLLFFFIAFSINPAREALGAFAGAWGIWTAAVAFYCGFAELTNEVRSLRTGGRSLEAAANNNDTVL
jgi:succinate-acetate transporter protein